MVVAIGMRAGYDGAAYGSAPMRGRALTITVMVAGAVFAMGCGGDDSDTASTTTTSGRSSASTTSTTRARSGVEVSPADRVEARFELQGGPDWLAADDRYVYVRLDEGSISRIDPQTNKVDASVQVGSLCQGLAVGFGSAWACRGTDVVRVDFTKRAVVASVPVGKVDGSNLLTAFDRVWVLTGDGTTMRDIDPTTNRAGPAIDLGVHGYELADDQRGIWVVSNVDNAVVLVDPASRAVTQRLTTTKPPWAVAFGSGTWVGLIGSTLHFDDAGKVVGTVDVGSGRSGSMAVNGDDLWIRSEEDAFLTHLDTRTGRTVEQFTAQASGGDVIVAFGSVWASAFDDALVVRLSPN
jgi:hypothetical protein